MFRGFYSLGDIVYNPTKSKSIKISDIINSPIFLYSNV